MSCSSKTSTSSSFSSTSSSTSSTSSSSSLSDCEFIDDNFKYNQLIDTIDSQIGQNLDFVQYEINTINDSFKEVINELKIENEKYKITINEINNIHDTIDNILIKINNCNCNNNCNSNCVNICNCDCKKKIYTDTTQSHTLVINNDIKFIYLTMVGGGGAGGVGFVKNIYYYSGGGGGSGACVINKPISVTIGTIITITVGKGSDARYDLKGGDTFIEILYPDLRKEVILVNGGKNGNPLIECNQSVKGGEGGSNYLCIFKGCNGHDGLISLPSYACANGGNGGSSCFYKGGNGGSSYFNSGGNGGCIVNLLGENGVFGSGGGGSCPKSKINLECRISGCGGDGIVIIEC